MKYLSILILSILLSSCGGTGRVTQTTFDPATGRSATVELSEYFESKRMIANEKVRAHLIVTLGKERLPKGYEFEHEIIRSQDQIEQVTVIYFTNLSKEPVSLSNMYLQSNSRRREILPETITIQPGKWVKSEPIMQITSIYRPNIESVLFYEYGGSNLSSPLPQIRAPVSELRGK